MQLYSVTIAGTYPAQCATVTDSREYAESIAAKIKSAFPHLRGVTYVEKASSFFPSHMSNADPQIIAAIR